MKGLLPLICLFTFSCTSMKQEKPSEKLSRPEDFEKVLDGRQVRLYHLKNGPMDITITNYGGRIVNMLVPAPDGAPVDVVTGPATLQGFIDSKEPYYGALIGRYGNRIAKGKFSLEDESYTLAVNNLGNHLHGGLKGFNNVVWDVVHQNDSTLQLKYVASDGEEGYPGQLSIEVTYSLSQSNRLIIDYKAQTNKRTVINLVNHAFFNLNGGNSGQSINAHTLWIDADRFTPVDSTLIPTGELASVENTPFDFHQPTAIGKNINDDNAQLKYGNGYDHNYVLNKGATTQPQLVARATGDQSGIVMEVLTTEPGLQFYGGNFMKGENVLKEGVKDSFRTAFCLETQHFPDSPNHPQFPSTVLEPGQVFHSQTIYLFK